MKLQYESLVREETNQDRIGHLLRKGWVQIADAPVIPFKPTEVPAYALKAAFKIDNLMAAVNTVVSNLPEPRRTIIGEKFAGSNPVERNNNFIKHLSNNIPALTPAKLDELFQKAYDIATDKSEL